jgi:hypothetical protein
MGIAALPNLTGLPMANEHSVAADDLDKVRREFF